ncbi:nuclease-related domain-containing protein [Comamonas sp. CMM02]|uniref:nuclease-related domain-containing protein n=1 Tax=Comamonas sp. CMM02 TaxID=2769307 RepID=UPI00177DD61C|nr:NERD domain-containing protein [Comamonas sp. CMM02]MBD9402971.1 NERD domain-containing protein [Comamonas sp. CMM02]
MATVLQQVQGVLWMWVVLAAGVALLAGVLRSPRFKGWWGERKVQQWLARDLNPLHYHCVHNVTLRLADGKTTQIDHVVVSPYGLFVLETKHMQGWIFGSEKQKKWTQSIYRHRTAFQNPLHQNWLHIMALQQVLQVPLQHLHSVVVFTGHSHFKTEMPACVTQGRDCVAFIQSHTEVVWTEQEVAQWRQALSQKRLQATRATHRAHVENVRARHAAPRPKVPSGKTAGAAVSAPVPVAAPIALRSTEPELCTEPVLRTEPFAPLVPQPAPLHAADCPQCGSNLVHRSLPDAEGASRYFWRCARFPHCRFMRAELPEVV